MLHLSRYQLISFEVAILEADAILTHAAEVKIKV